MALPTLGHLAKGGKRILIVSDTCAAHVNGVRHTTMETVGNLRQAGHTVALFDMDFFPSRIKIAIQAGHVYLSYKPTEYRTFFEAIRDFQPDAIHIETEGILGLLTSRYCLSLGLHYTSSLQTLWGEYLYYRYAMPETIGNSYLKWFHKRSTRILVSGPLYDEFAEAWFAPEQLAIWDKSIDASVFRPVPYSHRTTLPGYAPHYIYVGRIEKEKNIEEYLSAKVPGTKYVVGSGSCLKEYQKKYRTDIRKGRIRFLGERKREKIAELVARADVFVFPSYTDTFGLAMLEALSCGTPIAGVPASAQLYLTQNNPRIASLSKNIGLAMRRAAKLTQTKARRHMTQAACIKRAAFFSRKRITRQFFQNLVPVGARLHTPL